MTDVILRGILAKNYGESFKAVINSPVDAFRFLEANFPGFYRFIRDKEREGIDYRIVVNGSPIAEDALRSKSKIKEIEIIPVAVGAGDDPWAMIGAGVILVASVYFPPLGAMMSYGYGGMTVGSVVTGLGVSLIAGGVTSLIAGEPEIDVPALDMGKEMDAIGPSVPTNLAGSEESGRTPSQSHSYDGPVNTSRQGNPVPICYGGPIMVGSQVISVSIENEDV